MTTKANAPAKAPRPINSAVLQRQNALDLFGKASQIPAGSREELLDQREITLAPHPKYRLDSPIRWDVDPFGQRNWCAQLNMFRWVRPLVRSSDDGRQSEANELLEEAFRSWVESAYPQKEAAPYVWADMVEAVRVFEFMECFEYLRDDTQELMADVLYDHGKWIENEANLGHGNHAVWQHIALFVLGQLFAEEAWVDVAKSRILKAFNLAYDDQGINEEIAPGYHLYNFLLWSDVSKRMAAEDEEIPTLKETLVQARKGLIQSVRPDGFLEEIGDTSPRRSLVKLKGTDDVQYILTKGAEGELPENVSTVLDRGFIFLRSGWGENERDFEDEFFSSVRFGKHGIHGHYDLGSITVFANGEPLLIDAGKYAYVSDDAKSYVHKRSGHNTLYIEGLKELKDAEYRLVSSHPSADVDDYIIEGSPYSGVVHRRRILYIRGADALYVIDNVSSVSEHRYELLWHLNPKATLKKQRRGHDVRIRGKHYSLLALGKAPEFAIANGETEPKLDGWYSPKWGVLEPTPTIHHIKEGRRLRFMTVVASNGKGDFSVQSHPGKTTGAVLETSSGYFVVDADSVPAKVTFTREAPQLEATSGDGQEISNRDILASLSKSAVNDSLSTKLLSRLEQVIGTQASEAVLIEEALSSPVLKEQKDHGLRAALVDYLGYKLGSNSTVIANLINRNPLFRSPMIPARGVTLGDASTIVDVTYPLGQFTVGVSVVGENALAWQSRQNSDVLVVSLNGALDRAKVSMPYFGGMGRFKNRDESVLIFSDPALDKNSALRLGWYLGVDKNGQSIYKRIAQVVEEYVAAWGIKKLVIMGSSGGGYAALQVGMRTGDASILAMNPQTVLPNYFAPSYKLAIDSIFPTEKSARILETQPELIDTRELLASVDSSSTPIIYVDNKEGDVFHHKNHYQPFAHQAAANNVNIIHEVVDLGKGHKTVPLEMVDKYISKAVDMAPERTR